MDSMLDDQEQLHLVWYIFHTWSSRRYCNVILFQERLCAVSIHFNHLLGCHQNPFLVKLQLSSVSDHTSLAVCDAHNLIAFLPLLHHPLFRNYPAVSNFMAVRFLLHASGLPSRWWTDFIKQNEAAFVLICEVNRPLLFSKGILKQPRGISDGMFFSSAAKGLLSTALYGWTTAVSH